jgi:hypothetical protein
MTDTRQWASIKLSYAQWERILDTTLIGAKVTSRFLDMDPAEVKADLEAYEALKTGLERKGVIESEEVGPRIINTTTVIHHHHHTVSIP